MQPNVLVALDKSELEEALSPIPLSASSFPLSSVITVVGIVQQRSFYFNKLVLISSKGLTSDTRVLWPFCDVEQYPVVPRLGGTDRPESLLSWICGAIIRG
jgi:hypothetical protein